MDYFDFKKTKELEMEANKHGVTLSGEERIIQLERRLNELELRFNNYVRQNDRE